MFGMGTGGSLPLSPPDKHCPNCLRLNFEAFETSIASTKYTLDSSPSPRPISTSQLHASPHFHFWPINLVFYQGSYPVNPVRDLILGEASHLDAFSAYPFRT